MQSQSVADTSTGSYLFSIDDSRKNLNAVLNCVSGISIKNRNRNTTSTFKNHLKLIGNIAGKKGKSQGCEKLIVLLKCGLAFLFRSKNCANILSRRDAQNTQNSRRFFCCPSKELIFLFRRNLCGFSAYSAHLCGK
jgi:hypothetical protein